MTHRPILAFTLALGLALATTAGGALATESPIRLGIRPIGHAGTYFDLTLRPGERRTLQVELGNFGTQPVEVRTYAADVYSIVNGGLGAELHGERASGTTKWLDYAPQRLELPAGRGVVRDFVVEVPARARPGEYITSLVVQNAEPTAAGSSPTINQVNRVVIAVAITVPGPRRPALEIEGARHEVVNGISVVAFSVANPGNVHLRPEGEFALSAADGRILSRAELAMDTIYASTETVLEVPLANPLGPGAYCATLTLRDRDDRAGAAEECSTLVVAAGTADPPQAGGEATGGGMASPAGSSVGLLIAAAAALVLAVSGTAIAARVLRARGQRARQAR